MNYLPNRSTQPNKTSRLYRTMGHDTNSVSNEVVALIPLLELKINYMNYILIYVKVKKSSMYLLYYPISQVGQSNILVYLENFIKFD